MALEDPYGIHSYVISKIYGYTAILSVLGASFIVISYLIFPKIRNNGTTLVFFLGLADLGSSLGDVATLAIENPSLFHHKNSILDPLCQIQAGIIQFFSLSSFLWTSFIAHYSYSCFVGLFPRNILDFNMKIYILLGWIIPGITVGVAAGLEAFGQTEDHVWCWIKSDQNILRYAIYYGPLIFVWIFNSIILFLISRELKNSLSFHWKILQQKKRLFCYLLFFVILKLPALLNRSLQWAGYSYFWLYILQALGDSLLGFANAIIYGTSFKNFRFFCLKIIFWKKYQNEENIEDDQNNSKTPFIPSTKQPSIYISNSIQNYVQDDDDDLEDRSPNYFYQ